MITSEQTELNGEARLALLEAGPEDGQPLVLLHGIPAGAELWRGIMPRLAAEGYRCFAPNLPGYGMTRVAPYGDYSIFGAARLIDLWLNKIGLKLFHLMARAGIYAPAGRAEFQRHLASLDNTQTMEIAPELSDIDLPSLLIWSANDRFQPWERVGLRLKALLPNPDVKLIEQAGHFHVLEKPDTFGDALLTWRRE